MLNVGLDWAEERHEFEVLDDAGSRLKQGRVSADAAGLSRFHEILAGLTEDPGQVAIAIESGQGLWVNALVGAGYRVYPINPMLSARTREGRSPSRSKSDRGDARLLAELVRTQRHELRALQGDSEEAQAVRVRARSHVRAIRMQQRLRNQLRSALLQYFAAAVKLLGEEPEDLRDALAVLSVARTPEQGRRLSLSKLEATLKRHGRQRNLAAKAGQIQNLLRAPQLELSGHKVLAAHADEVGYLVRTLLQLRSEIGQLEKQLAADFRKHPDAAIYLSFPGLAEVLGARVLGESGDDPARFANARARKNYAGNSPITKASGKRRQVSRRLARNRLLADAGFQWASAAITASPGARCYYDRLRSRQQLHNQAIRALANRLTGVLHACLQQHCLYEEAKAWAMPPTEEVAA